MSAHAVAPRRSLTFALLAVSASFVHADSTLTQPASAMDVTVTEHALPPQEIGAPPAAPPRTLTLPHIPVSEKRPGWNRVDRSLAASYLVLAGMDAWQTGHLPQGYVEGNPVVSSWAGERPSFEHALAFKTVTAYGALALASRLKRPAQRRAVLVLINVVQASVVVMNERRTGGIMF